MDEQAGAAEETLGELLRRSRDSMNALSGVVVITEDRIVYGKRGLTNRSPLAVFDDVALAGAHAEVEPDGPPKRLIPFWQDMLKAAIGRRKRTDFKRFYFNVKSPSGSFVAEIDALELGRLKRARKFAEQINQFAAQT